MITTILKWILWMFLIGFVCQVVARAVRWFIHFPIPAAFAWVVDNPVRRMIQPPEQVVNWIGIQEGMCVLEVGSGPGTFTIEAARHVGEDGRLFAVDIQLAMVSKLNSRLQREGVSSVMAVVASACDLPFPDRVFDLVFMITVLPEIPERRRALLEAKRVLRDGGLLAIGECLLDPDYPRSKTVISWCREAGFELVCERRGILHYLLRFRKPAGGA